MKQLLCLLTSLSVFFACSTPNSKDSVKTTDITGELSGEVIFAGQGIHNYYDVAITNDYYAFMDYYSDTLLQIRSKKDLSLHGIGEREKEGCRLSYNLTVLFGVVKLLEQKPVIRLQQPTMLRKYLQRSEARSFGSIPNFKF